MLDIVADVVSPSSGYTTGATQMLSIDAINEQVNMPREGSSVLEVTNVRTDVQSSQHHMVIGTKNGIFKPNVYMLELSQVKPNDIHETMGIPSWRKAVDDELQELIRNET